MPSTIELVAAIGNRDLTQVQNILSVRREDGTPEVDVNSSPCVTVSHYVLFQLKRETHEASRETLVQIFQYIISLRNQENNPVADLNLMHRNAGNVLTLAVEVGDAQILQSILDTRNADGSHVIDLVNTAGGLDSFWHPLVRALYMNLLSMVQALVDCRDANGGLLLTREHQLAALRRVFQCQRTANPAVLYLLQELGIAGQWPPQQQAPQRRPQTQRLQRAAQPVRPANHQPNAFDNDAQNTHDPSVTHTVKGSLSALNNRYGSGLIEEAAIAAIEALLEEFDYNSITIQRSLADNVKKQYAKQFFELLKRRFQHTHSYTGYTNRKIMALGWSAIVDTSIECYPLDLRHILNQNPNQVTNLVQLKKASLIEKFIEATLVYRENIANLDICVGGGIHKMLETLNRAHIDVVISAGQQSVLPLANDMAISLIGQVLLSKSAQDQSRILSLWNQDGSIASTFKEEMKEPVKTKLHSHFGILVTQDQLDNIVSVFEDLPRPHVPSAELNSTVDEIENISPSGSHAKKATLEAIKVFAREIYFSEGLPAEKVILLNQITDKFKQADALIQEITNIPSDATNLNRQAAILDLKAQAETIYSDGDLSFQEKFEQLSSAYNSFKKIDQFFSDFVKGLSSFNEISNPQRQAAVSKLIAYADGAFDATQVKVISKDLLAGVLENLCKLDQLIQEILSTPEDSSNVYRNQAIQQLKSLARQILDGLEGLLDTVNIAKIKSNLEQEYKFFSQFDKLAIGLREIEHRYSGANEKRLQRIRGIKEITDICYREYSIGTPRDVCQKTLVDEINHIRLSVETDHQKYGAGRFFSKIKPRTESRLVRAINNSLSLKK